ncbi:ATP-binding protein [Niveibacterium sp. COAC-50]|uniref:ATP-binding protein n=1 Tax=Niveibacterium sp. COAC-50 TaxID=2729384 RepID=UPI0015566506
MAVSTEPFDVLRRGTMALLALYGVLVLGASLALLLPAPAHSELWLNPSAGGMALAAALALSSRITNAPRLRAATLLVVALTLVPLVLAWPPASLASRLWPEASRSWPAILCAAAWAIWAWTLQRPAPRLARLLTPAAVTLVCGGALVIASNHIHLDLMYGQRALRPQALPLAGAMFMLAILLLRERSRMRPGEQREESLISRIGLGLLTMIAFATGLISFAALQAELETALYQHLEATLQTRQFVFYSALDALHLNSAPLVRDRQIGALLAHEADKPDAATVAKLQQMVDELLPPANPSQTARASIARAVSIRNARGQELARHGDFLDGTVLWSTTRRRSDVSLLWHQGVPFALQRLDIEDAQRNRVGEIVIQHAVPAWEQLAETDFDLGNTGQMAICGLYQGAVRCLRSRNPEALWMPRDTAVRSFIDAATLYGEAGDSSTPQLLRDEQGRTAVIAYRPMGRLNLSRKVSSNGLMMLITVDAQEFYAPLRRLLHRVLLFALPTILLGGWLLTALIRPLVRALRDKQARFRELTELSSDWYWTMDADLRLVEIVGKGLADADIRPADWVGHTLEGLPLSTDDASGLAPLLARMTRHAPFHAVALRLQTQPDGPLRYLELSGAPQFLHGRFVGYRGVGIDVTERRVAQQHLQRAEQELMRSEKLASLGRLVAGVAHELNTPLGNGITAASSLAGELRDFGRTIEGGSLRRSALQDFTNLAQQTVSLIERSLSRAAHIVQQFKQVAVDQSTEGRRHYLLHQVTDELFSLLQPRLRPQGVALTIAIAPDIEMDGYPGALEQVIENLAMNALIHAFDGRADGELEIAAHRSGADHVRLVVRDNGRGMSDRELARAFEPFFTTRLGTGGSGLGLYIVHTIVCDVLGGSVTLDSAPGAGCIVTLELPLAAP